MLSSRGGEGISSSEGSCTEDENGADRERSEISWQGLQNDSDISKTGRGRCEGARRSRGHKDAGQVEMERGASSGRGEGGGDGRWQGARARARAREPVLGGSGPEQNWRRAAANNGTDQGRDGEESKMEGADTIAGGERAGQTYQKQQGTTLAGLTASTPGGDGFLTGSLAKCTRRKCLHLRARRSARGRASRRQTKARRESREDGGQEEMRKGGRTVLPERDRLSLRARCRGRWVLARNPGEGRKERRV